MKTLRPMLEADLNKLITEWRLHDRWDEPIVLGPAIEEYRIGYMDLEGCADAITYHWCENEIEYYRIVYDWSLSELKNSAKKRSVEAHETGHVVSKQTGSEFGVIRNRPYYKGLEPWLEDLQEEECEMTAAYLLVPVPALERWAAEDATFIARKLDVTVNLVKLRREMIPEQIVREIEAQQALFIFP